MPGRTVSRRMVVGLLGSGVAFAPAVGQAFAAHSSVTKAEAEDAVGKALLAPLGPGDKIARWTIEAIRPLAEGAVKVVVKGDGGGAFELEIMARDASPLAPRAPGEAGRFSIYVRNGGDGYAPTNEEQGLAAMTLAAIVKRNEAGVSAEGFLTHEARFSQHRRALTTKGPKNRRGT